MKIQSKNVRTAIKIGGWTLLALCAIIFWSYLGYSFLNFGPGLGDYSYKIANVCELYSTSAQMIYVKCDGIEGGVGPKVIKVGWDDNYVVAYTHPVTKTSSNNPNCLNCEPDESVTYWWIIDIKNKLQYGPLNSEEAFNNKKKNLGIGAISLLTLDEAKKAGVCIDDYYAECGQVKD